MNIYLKQPSRTLLILPYSESAIEPHQLSIYLIYCSHQPAFLPLLKLQLKDCFRGLCACHVKYSSRLISQSSHFIKWPLSHTSPPLRDLSWTLFNKENILHSFSFYNWNLHTFPRSMCALNSPSFVFLLNGLEEWELACPFQHLSSDYKSWQIIDSQ